MIIRLFLKETLSFDTKTKFSLYKTFLSRDCTQNAIISGSTVISPCFHMKLKDAVLFSSHPRTLQRSPGIFRTQWHQVLQPWNWQSLHTHQTWKRKTPSANALFSKDMLVPWKLIGSNQLLLKATYKVNSWPTVINQAPPRKKQDFLQNPREMSLKFNQILQILLGCPTDRQFQSWKFKMNWSLLLTKWPGEFTIESHYCRSLLAKSPSSPHLLEVRRTCRACNTMNRC